MYTRKYPEHKVAQQKADLNFWNNKKTNKKKQERQNDREK